MLNTFLEKGLNKGEILSGAVDWVRDLMWVANILLHLHEEISRNLGYDFHVEQKEGAWKMLDELREAIMATYAHSFGYSRAQGDGSGILSQPLQDQLQDQNLFRESRRGHCLT